MLWSLLVASIWIQNLPVVRTYSCDTPTNMTTWLKDPSNTSITVQWAYGEMTCHTTSGCFGEDSMKNETDAKLVPQMLPLQTQPGVAIRFRVSNHMGITGAIQPFKVTEEGFRKCNTSLGVPIISNATEELIVVDKQFLSLGMNYFIVDSDENAFLKCEFGLRLNITIKTAECAKYSLNSEVCGENGNCVTKFEKEKYTCECCDGYQGDFCDVLDPCSSYPCGNNGDCLYDSKIQRGYHCNCSTGFQGGNCEEYIDDLCDLRLCENNATCTGNHFIYNCSCLLGFTGDMCETDIDDCADSPCVYGICVDKVNGYGCFCLPGYYGEHCQHEYNECLTHPCINGGECVDLIDRFHCNCGRGYTGETCSVKVDLCFPNPCHNASCSDLGNTYKCHCKDGYGGNHCETNINECNPNPCHHGGTCRDLINDYECYCTEAHAGTNCEYSLDLFSPPLDSVTMKGKNHLHNLYLVAGTLSGAILIVIIVVAGCYCRMHETYKHLTWKQIRYRRQKDDSPGSCLDVSSVAKTRPSIDAIWEATSINYSDDLLTSPLHDSLKPKKV